MRSKVLSALDSLLLGLAFAAPLRADNRVIPPEVTKIWPVGMQRGTTATFTLDGRNLSDIKAVIFDSPGITAKVTQDYRRAGKERPSRDRVESAPRTAAARSKRPPLKSPLPKMLRRACTGSGSGRRWEPRT